MPVLWKINREQKTSRGRSPDRQDHDIRHIRVLFLLAFALIFAGAGMRIVIFHGIPSDTSVAVLLVPSPTSTSSSFISPAPSLAIAAPSPETRVDIAPVPVVAGNVAADITTNNAGQTDPNAHPLGGAYGSVDSAMIETSQGRDAILAKTAPTVFGFWPPSDSTNAPREIILSVSFATRMDRKITAAALRVTNDDKIIAGGISWGAGDTVLSFVPQKALPYGAKITVSISSDARSLNGLGMVAASTATFTTLSKVTAGASPTHALSATSAPVPTSATNIGAGSWASVERHFLDLMNCTRTGGWVASDGSCSGSGTRAVAPLIFDPAISNAVARPYASFLAERGACDHFLEGNPGDRLRQAGFGAYDWGENLGCPSGDPNAGAIATMLFFQSEKPWNGGHYANLMNASFTRVGLGIWVSNGNVRIVTDFYGG